MFSALAFIFLAVVVIIAIPLLFLWTLDVLFALDFEYSPKEWLAALLLMLFIGAAAVL